MLFVCHPKLCISIVFSFSWELKWPQEKRKTETENNAYAKFWGDKKEHYGMLWYFLEWSSASSVGIPSHIAGTTGLKQRKLCTSSDWPCKMPRRMAKVEKCCLRLNELWCSREFRRYVAALSGDWGDSHDVRTCFQVVRERYSLRPKMSRKES